MNTPSTDINNLDGNLSLRRKFVENYNGFRLYNEEYQNQASELMLISKLIETINSSEDVRQIETKLQEIFQNIIAIDFCSLLFWEKSKQKLLPISYDSEQKSKNFVNKLIEEGIADWIISEKDIAIVPDLETTQSEIKKFFIIVPLIQSKIDFGLLVLRTSYSKSDILPKKLLLISILANLAFSAIANTHLCSRVARMSEEIVVLGDEISDLSKIAVVGEMSDNFFHTMKNRIQVMISSIELLNKNVRTEEVMKILKEEVDRTAKALKSISDFSRGMIAKYDYGYYNVNLLITSTVDVLETTLSKAKLNITIKENPKHPHVYGSANSITQMLLFLLNELRKQLSVGGSIQIESTEQSERINIKITVQDENSPGKDFYSSFIEGENVKFAAAKRLIEQNRGAFTSAVEANNRIVFSITIPKRARGLKTITSN